MNRRNQISKKYFMAKPLVKLLLIFLVINTAGLSQTDPYSRAYKFYVEGNYQKSIEILSGHIKTSSGKVDSYKLLIESYRKLSKNNEAKEVALEGIKHFPNDPDILYVTASLFLVENDYQNSFKYLEKYFIRKPHDSEAKDLLNKLAQNIAINFYNNKDYSSAVEWFQKAMSFKSKDLDLTTNVVSLLIHLERYSEALKYLKTAMNDFPHYSKFIELYADVLIQKQEYRDALIFLEKIHKKYPEDFRYALKLALIYRYNSKVDEALLLYETLRKKFPKEKEIYEAEIQYYELVDEHEKVRKLFRAMLSELEPDNDFYFKIGDTFEKEKRFEEARKYYRSLADTSKDNFKFLMKIANIFIAEGKESEAVAELKEIIAENNLGYDAYKLLGGLLEKKGEFSSAFDYYYKYYSLFPHDYNTSFLIAKLFFTVGKRDSSLKYFQISRELKANYPATNYYLASLQDYYSDTASAIKFYKKTIHNCLKELDLISKNLAGMTKSGSLNLNSDELTNNEKSDLNEEELSAMIGKSFNYLRIHLSDDEYQDYIEKLLASDNTNIFLLTKKAEYLESRAKFDEALILCESILRFNSTFVDAHRIMFRIYNLENKIDEALLTLQRILGLESDKKKIYEQIINYAQKYNRLNRICDDWLQKYKISRNEELKERLIEALHKAGRIEDAQKVINNLI